MASRRRCRAPATLRMTRPLPRPVDSLLVMLSRSADRSVLWVALAAIRPIVPTTIRITPTVGMLMPATWAVTANFRIAPPAIAHKLKPTVID